MRDRKKRNIIIGSLCCLLVFMAVGYAILSQALNISGNANLSGEWKIYIESITEITEGNTTSGKSIYTELIGKEKTEAYFEVDLRKPGDYVEYKVIVKNEGNIDATLRELATYSNIEHPDVVFSHTLEQGALLKGGETKEFTVKVEFLKSATEIPGDTYLDYTMYMLYEQFDGNTMTTPPNLETDNSCFTVSADGTLEGYDYNCGLDVTVPASVNGTNITKITKDSFMPTDEKAQEMGYGKYYIVDIYNMNETKFMTFYVAEDEFSYNKMLQEYDITTKGSIYTHAANEHYFINSRLSELYVYTSWAIIPLTKDGEETYDDESAEYMIYWYLSPEVFYVAPDQESYEAAIKYVTSIGEDTSLVYLDGDSNIPKENYKVKYETATESQGIIKEGITTHFTMGTNKTNINSFTNLITSLDLSNAKYLENINARTQFDNLTKLVLPENGMLTTIGERAFFRTKLTNVTIPSTVTSIGDLAFSGGSLLEEIRINRKSSGGITFGDNWKNDNAIVKYIGK